MASVTIDGLTKSYTDDAPLAVNDLDLAITDGEFLVLLGPSGCGKTTTLRCIAGLETVTGGDIHIGEVMVNDLPPADRDIAFVFQFYALYPHKNAYDNIAFPLRAMKVPEDEVAKRVTDVAKLLRIEHVLGRRPRGMPSGEQQRIALGRAIIRHPQVFLMDEPLTNLDASLRADMRVELKHLCTELETTTVYVTHDQTEAMSMADRIAIMNLGVLQQVGSPLEVYDEPATLFVAGFIGTPPMNLIGVHRADDGVTDPSGAIRLTGSRFSNLPDVGAANGSEPFVLGVRSEDLKLVDPTHVSDAEGTVLVVEPLGDEIIYEVDVAGEVLLAKTEPTLRLAPGENVGLRFDRDRLHIFDAVGEQAIR